MNPTRSKKETVLLLLFFALTFLICVALRVCTANGIYFTSFVVGTGADRLDVIDGFYVRITELPVCCYEENGERKLCVGADCDEASDVLWRHEELHFISPYRRIWFAAKKTGFGYYTLTNAENTVEYGTVYVLYARSGLIHYYYFRDEPHGRTISPLMTEETVSFEYRGEKVALENGCRLSSEIDFTENGEYLTMQGERLWFRD